MAQFVGDSASWCRQLRAILLHPMLKLRHKGIEYEFDWSGLLG
jgi:hypothetical protein